MIETIYRDLAEFGLVFIAPGEPGFDLKLEEIRRLPVPFGPDLDCTPERAAVLKNQTASAVITWMHVWRYTDTSGKTRSSSHLNLGSSRQMDVLTGREKATRDLGSFLLPGSGRIITEDGVFGDNRDVLGPPPATGSGWAGARARIGGRGTAESDEHTIARIELEIDVAIFEDGLCVGADEYGLRESLTEQIQQQLDTAGEIVRMLDGGATPGRIFKMLRPLARHRLAPPAALPEAMNIRPVGALGRRGLHRTP